MARAGSSQDRENLHRKNSSCFHVFFPPSTRPVVDMNAKANVGRPDYSAQQVAAWIIKHL